ncbi:MAG TPA: hypothetical protein VIY90_10940 [Steroidobacteraceae bacterium]
MDTDSAIARRLDCTVLIAVACVACSWFFMNSLITDYGAVRLQFRFYNMFTLMHSPGRIVTGAFGDGAIRDAWLFGAVCTAALLAALAPAVCTHKAAWLGCAAPFALMALSGAILHHGFSQDLVADDGLPGDSALRLSHFANQLANRVGGMITHQIHVGVGGYLAVAASTYLAAKGLRSYQNAS